MDEALTPLRMFSLVHFVVDDLKGVWKYEDYSGLLKNCIADKHHLVRHVSEDGFWALFGDEYQFVSFNHCLFVSDIHSVVGLDDHAAREILRLQLKNYAHAANVFNKYSLESFDRVELVLHVRGSTSAVDLTKGFEIATVCQLFRVLEDFYIGMELNSELALDLLGG